MPPPPPDLEPSATHAKLPDFNDPVLSPFLAACEKDNVELALQLARDRDPSDSALTWGLNKAVNAGHLNIARRLLELGVKWDAQTIYDAAASLDTTKLLVEFGFKVNDALPGGWVILPRVVARNDIGFVRYLLSQGADPNLGPPLCPQESTSWQMRPIRNSGEALNRAAVCSTPEMIELLLSHGAVLANAVPLHFAAHGRSNAAPGAMIPMMEYLLGLGLDVNAMDLAVRAGIGQYGTPLHCAIRTTRDEEARWLVEKGADPKIKLPPFAKYRF